MDKTVFITGGTKGIGKAVACVFAKNGYSPILTYSSDDKTAEECAEEIKSSYGVEVSVLRADSTEKQSIDVIDSYLRTSGKQLDTVVFNAAVTLRTSFEETTFEQWDRVFFANVHFPVFLLQKIVRHIVQGGNIIFTGSLMGIQPHGTSLSYGVTKSVDTDWQKTKPAEIRRNIENKIAAERFCLPAEVADVYLMLARNRYFNGEIVKIDGGYSYK